jgi:alpha-L-fucosidase
VRWCGNEAGRGRVSEWSIIPLPVPAEQFDWPDMTAQDLGSVDRLAGAAHLHWYPSEVDVSIRPGWFWHETENNRVKSLDKLIEIYFSSVGNNAVLLLNVPPDRRGLIHENDVARLGEFGEWLRASFKTDLAKGANAAASHMAAGHPARLVVDDDPESYWTAADWQKSAELTLRLPGRQRFNVAMLQEQIRHGQRIESFAIDARVAGSWQELGRATTVGYKRLLRFDTVETDEVRVRILDARVCPTLANVGLFLEAPRSGASPSPASSP